MKQSPPPSIPLTLYEGIEQLSPEDRIDRRIQTLVTLIAMRRCPGRMDRIKKNIAQLRREWSRYQRGELPWLIGGREVR